MFCQQFVLAGVKKGPVPLCWSHLSSGKPPLLWMVSVSLFFPSPSSLLLILRCRILQSSPVSRDVFSGPFSFISFFTVIKLLFRKLFILNSWLTIICTLHRFFSLFLEAHFSIRKSPNCPLAEVVSWTVLKRAEWLPHSGCLTWVAKATAGSAWGHFACRSDSAEELLSSLFLVRAQTQRCCFSPLRLSFPWPPFTNVSF